MGLDEPPNDGPPYTKDTPIPDGLKGQEGFGQRLDDVLKNFQSSKLTDYFASDGTPSAWSFVGDFQRSMIIPQTTCEALDLVNDFTHAIGNLSKDLKVRLNLNSQWPNLIFECILAETGTEQRPNKAYATVWFNGLQMDSDGQPIMKHITTEDMKRDTATAKVFYDLTSNNPRFDTLRNKWDRNELLFTEIGIIEQQVENRNFRPTITGISETRL